PPPPRLAWAPAPSAPPASPTWRTTPATSGPRPAPSPPARRPARASATRPTRDGLRSTSPARHGGTLAVPPPPAPQSGFRAAEMDPIVELYGPGGGLIAQVDEARVGEPEQMQVNLAAGRHTLRVLSFDGSASPGPYTVQVLLGTELASSAWAPSQSAFRPDAEADATTVADFNGDGRQDVALLTGFDHDAPIENELQLYVLLQQPGGTLGAPHQ